MRPQPDTAICDPACGTGGFLLAALEQFTQIAEDLGADRSPALRFSR